MIQDPKHPLKIYRNDLYSGARFLVLGNFFATYGTVLKASQLPGSPLFKREVHNVDRQDDNAHVRLFSADHTSHVAEKVPEQLFPVMLLFIFGGLIDAHQNRHISIAERLKIVFRAHHFIHAW